LLYLSCHISAVSVDGGSSWWEGPEFDAIGTIVAIDEASLLRERIQIGVDRDLGREVYDERSKALSLEEARHLLQEWQRDDIAEVFQIPWD
jgi:hypothetical protein